MSSSPSSSSNKQHEQPEDQSQKKTMTYHQAMVSWKLTIVTFVALSSAVIMIALAVWGSKNNKKGHSFSYFQYEDDHDWDSIDIQLQGQSLCELASSLPGLTLLDQGAWSGSSNCPNEQIQTTHAGSVVSVPVWCSSPWQGITCDDDTNSKVIKVNISGLNSAYAGSRTSTKSSTIPSSLGITLAGSLTYLVHIHPHAMFDLTT